MSLSFASSKYTPFRHQYVPNVPGIYRIVVDGSVRYVGKATSLRRRYIEHLDERYNMALRALIVGGSKLCFEYAVVYEKDRLQQVETKYIHRHVDTVMGVQFHYVR